jgi:hypothetical protein
MSKQSDAKERQMYTPKFVPMTCSNCAHMKCDMELPAWMGKQPGVWDDKYKLEKNHRCGLGGFAVKKMGSCNEHTYCEEAQT